MHVIIALYNTFYVLDNRVLSTIIKFRFDEDVGTFLNKNYVNLFFTRIKFAYRTEHASCLTIILYVNVKSSRKRIYVYTWILVFKIGKL